MNATENNKLIAEFLGYVNTTPTDKDFNIYEGKNKVLPNLIETNFEKRFHTDWNWLMEVVQKINDQNNVVQIHENHVMVVNNTKGEILVDVVSGSMLEATYDAVVQYIKLKK